MQVRGSRPALSRRQRSRRNAARRNSAASRVPPRVLRPRRPDKSGGWCSAACCDAPLVYCFDAATQQLVCSDAAGVCPAGAAVKS